MHDKNSWLRRPRAAGRDCKVKNTGRAAGKSCWSRWRRHLSARGRCCRSVAAKRAPSASYRSAQAKRTAIVRVIIGKTEDVRTDTNFVDIVARRSRNCRRQSADRPFAVNPRPQKRHDARFHLRRGQEADRRVRRRGGRLTPRCSPPPPTLAQRFPYAKQKVTAVNGRIMLTGTLARRRNARRGCAGGEGIRLRSHQFGAGVGAAASHAGSALRRSQPPGFPRELGIQWNVFGQQHLANIGNRTPAGSFRSPTPAASLFYAAGRHRSAARTSRPGPSRSRRSRSPACCRAPRRSA